LEFMPLDLTGDPPMKTRAFSISEVIFPLSVYIQTGTCSCPKCQTLLQVEEKSVEDGIRYTVTCAKCEMRGEYDILRRV
jgi:hypothetical protein